MTTSDSVWQEGTEKVFTRFLSNTPPTTHSDGPGDPDRFRVDFVLVPPDFDEVRHSALQYPSRWITFMDLDEQGNPWSRNMSEAACPSGKRFTYPSGWNEDAYDITFDSTGCVMIRRFGWLVTRHSHSYLPLFVEGLQNLLVKIHEEFWALNNMNGTARMMMRVSGIHPKWMSSKSPSPSRSSRSIHLTHPYDVDRLKFAVEDSFPEELRPKFFAS